jgi:hypothetical protein
MSVALMKKDEAEQHGTDPLRAELAAAIESCGSPRS